ncbi:isochorismatase family protein [Psychromonas sp. KJ10-10]|uniref:isochorismatase family protein n=1 Tax=Psychromonas sp. KJ10-10 TaxID=3391823 RepID=UPI0039B5672C
MMKIEKSITASFDVDPQCGFTFLCPDELPIYQGDEIADELNAQAQFASYRLVSKDSHPADALWITNKAEEIMTPVEGYHPDLDIKWPAHCIVGTKGNQLIPGLPEEKNYDLLIEKGVEAHKHPYGACYHDLANNESTGVIEWLKQRNIEVVIVGGLATDFCVKTTVLQLREAGFKVIVNLVACRGVDSETSKLACDEMRDAGVELINASSDLEAL